MTEKILYLDNIDPFIFYGINNTKFERIKAYYSKLKIVARGDVMKISGDEAEVARFDQRTQLVINHIIKYNHITEEQFDILFFGSDVGQNDDLVEDEDVILYNTSGKQIKARTQHQRVLLEASRNNDLIFAIGPAGTGKTYISIALAVKALRNKEVKRIILTRPAVEAGERLGFLPGDLKEKLDPYLQPLYDALNDMMPARKLSEYMEENIIQIAPLAFMRGRTLDNAFVILDEAQNATTNQIKMFLTRMGMSSKFAVTGDLTQIDLPRKSDSGLFHALRILKNIEGISVIEFDENDIVRHRLVKDIVLAYERNKPQRYQDETAQDADDKQNNNHN